MFLRTSTLHPGKNLQLSVTPPHIALTCPPPTKTSDGSLGASLSCWRSASFSFPLLPVFFPSPFIFLMCLFTQIHILIKNNLLNPKALIFSLFSNVLVKSKHQCTVPPLWGTSCPLFPAPFYLDQQSFCLMRHFIHFPNFSTVYMSSELSCLFLLVFMG